MFLFNAHTSFFNSFKHHFSSTADNMAMAIYFDGAVPNSVDEIPFDYQDLYEVQRHLVHAQTLSLVYGDVGVNRSSIRATTRTRFDVKVNTPYPGTDKYYLAPYRLMSSLYFEDDGTIKNPDSHGDNETYLRAQHFFYRFDNRLRVADPAMSKANDNWDGGSPADSSTDNYIFDYDGQEVTVEEIAYITWKAAGNTPSVWTFDWWDATANDGAGDWVEAITYSINDTFYFSQNLTRFIKLPTAVTSTRFRFRWNNTGGGSFALNQLNLIGPQPAWNTDARDITWALLYPYQTVYSNFFSRYNTSSYNKSTTSGYPVIMCNVGTVGSGAPIELDRTLMDRFRGPTVQNFNLEFKDSL